MGTEETQAITREQIEDLVARWPGVTSSTKWEIEEVFTVAKKMFAVLSLVGPERGRLSFKVDADQFTQLCERPGMMAAPYTARTFWISVVEPTRFGHAELAGYIRRSYELVVEGLSPKARERLEASEPVR